MFKPCPNCGFLVALIAGREASQRCPRCGSAMLEDGELPPGDEAPTRRRADVQTAAGDDRAHGVASSASSAHASRVHEATPGARERSDTVGIAGHASSPVTTEQQNPRDDAIALDAPASGEAGDEPDPQADAAVVPARTAAQPSSTPIRDTPSFASRRARTVTRRGRQWPWLVALPLLALLLAVQVLLSQREELARSARWRPWVATACGVLGCDVPAWREPAAFAMLARNVRPHPARAGVLHVTTSVRNDAAWPQPLPTVVLSLSDVDGRVLAARAVPPSEYSREPRALVATGDSVDIAFDVREPSPRVVSFDFQLR